MFPDYKMKKLTMKEWKKRLRDCDKIGGCVNDTQSRQAMEKFKRPAYKKVAPAQQEG